MLESFSPVVTNAAPEAARFSACDTGVSCALAHPMHSDRIPRRMRTLTICFVRLDRAPSNFAGLSSMVGKAAPLYARYSAASDLTLPMPAYLLVLAVTCRTGRYPASSRCLACPHFWRVLPCCSAAVLQLDSLCAHPASAVLAMLTLRDGSTGLTVCAGSNSRRTSSNSSR